MYDKEIYGRNDVKKCIIMWHKFESMCQKIKKNKNHKSDIKTYKQ